MNSSIYFAPLQSYTTLPYYLAFSQLFCGVDKFFTPFYRKNKQGLFEYEKQLKAISGLSIIPQVLTNSASDLVLFATEMMDRGFKEINLNLGCPFPMVANRRLGSGLLPFKDDMEKLLEGYFKHHLKVRLSIKTRLGWSDSKEVIALIKMLNEFSVEEFILHPRLGIQKYTGKPDWEAFERIVSQQKNRFVANGDITTLNQLNVLQQRFPEVEGWMLGRGLLTHPFMLEGDMDSEQKRGLLLQLHNLFFEKLNEFGYMDSQILNHLKTFWEYPSNNFVDGSRAYRKIKKAGKLSEYRELMLRMMDLDMNA